MTGEASVVFNMKPGDISGPVNSGANGVVLSLLEVQAPTEDDFAAKRDEIREQLLQSQKQELFGLFVNNVRQQMEKSGKIKINQDELKALTHAESESGI
jgi:peptidyl-prolyl cis-trans isomerase D